MPKSKLTKNEFVHKANLIHHNQYYYHLFNYLNSRTCGIIVCKIHGNFELQANAHLQGSGCQGCLFLNTVNNFFLKAYEKHGDEYDYSKFIYTNSKTKSIIICKIHGEFKQSPNVHISGNEGSGCPKCGKTRTIQQFINKANIIHNFKYEYKNTIYISATDILIVTCPNHGDFTLDAFRHLSGQGCPQCAKISFKNKKTKTTESFIDKANLKHNFKYGYQKFIYLNRASEGIITCYNHGDFSQRAGAHLQGEGCPKCSVGISKSEIEWLNYLNIPEKFRHKTIKINGTKYNLDAIDEENKIIYEFNGDFWHGNPDVFNKNDVNNVIKKTFGELYNNTIKKENELKIYGYTVISIWENDWNKIKEKK